MTDTIERIVARLALCTGLVGGALAQIPDPVFRSWAPRNPTIVKIAAGDIDGDQRDDALLLTSAGELLRAFQPGIASAIHEWPIATGIRDVLFVRSQDAGAADRLLTVDSTVGLAEHVYQTDGSTITAPAGLPEWTSIARLATIHVAGQELIAGLDVNGTTMRFLRLTTGFSPLTTLVFSEPLVDFELGYWNSDLLPDVVGLTANGLVARGLDQSTLPGHPASGTPGAITRFGNESTFAWLRRQAGGPHWELVRGSGMALTVPVPLVGFSNPVLDTLQLTDLVAGDVDGDPHVDLVIGQASSSDLVVLHGSPLTPSMDDIEVLPRPVAGGQSILDTAPPVLAQLDNHGQLGILHARHADRTLGVTFGTNEQSGHMLTTSIELVEPLLYDPGEPGLLDDRLQLSLQIAPAPFTHLQITVWKITGTHDDDGGATANLAQVVPAMVDDFWWTLHTTQGGQHTVQLPLEIHGDEYWEAREHVLLQIRLIDYNEVAEQVEDAGWTHPFIMAMRSHPTDPYEIMLAFLTEWFGFPFPSPGYRLIRIPAGSRNVGAIHAVPPTPPPIHGDPIPSPRTGQGTTSGS